MCRWRHKIRKTAVEILQSVNNRTQCLLESAYYAWLLFTYIVINTILGRLTPDILPVCIVLRGTMLLFLVCFFVCPAPSPERRAFEGCIVRTRIALPFTGRFRRRLDRFFRKWLHFQTRYIVLTFVARWRHNVREIAVKNCEKSKNRRKSLCAPLRTDSWGFWKKFYHTCLGPRL